MPAAREWDVQIQFHRRDQRAGIVRSCWTRLGARRAQRGGKLVKLIAQRILTGYFGA
jgi:hypothetical protein